MEKQTQAAIQLPDDIGAIARIIRSDWKNIYYGAAPYLKAMQQLNSIHDQYYEDSAKSVVLYFLVNAATWRGTTAKAVKAKLRELIKQAA